MIKILFDCERLKYPNTGLYTFCKSLGIALVENSGSKYSVTPYVSASERDAIYSAQSHLLQRFWHKLVMPDVSKFDVWHSTSQASKYFPFKSKLKKVLTIHDLNFLIEKSDHPYKISRYLNQIQKRINEASAIVCISYFVAQQVREFLKVDSEKLSVIYNGCSIKDYPEFNSPRYNPKKPFLFSIGTVLPKKNFHVLPALLRGNDYELIIAGNLSSTKYVNEIISAAESYGVQDRLNIIGSISEEERSWYYKNCSGFVFPSIAEGFGLPVIEAMHYGKAVFLSTHTSLPEIGGDAAFYFQNFEPEHMQQILKNGLEYFSLSDMAQKARNRASEFDWNDTAKAYLRIYNSIS